VVEIAQGITLEFGLDSKPEYYFRTWLWQYYQRPITRGYQ